MLDRSDRKTEGAKGMAGPLNNAKTLRVFLVFVLGGLGAIPLVFLTPPFQVPDEVQHFYRAYQLSEFGIRSEVENGVAGGVLPESLQRLVTSSVHTVDGLVYPASPAPIANTLHFVSMPLNESVRKFVGFPGSAFYSPLPYLPQMIGIAIGRLFGAGPLQLLYLGRLFNCLAALVLVALAVKTIPAGEDLVVLVAMLPTSMFLYASVSADTAVISCTLLFSALTLSATARGEWKKGELVAAVAVATVFCSVKPVYAPLLFAGVVPGAFQAGKAKKILRSHAVLVAIAMGVTVSWLLFAKSSMTMLPSKAHPVTQAALVLHRPIFFIRALAHALGIRPLISYYAQAVGIFGWNTVWLAPGIIYLLPLVNLFGIWKFSNVKMMERSFWRGWWCLLLAVISVILILAAMYLMSAQVGEQTVTGVQGRYFIPILVIAVMALFMLIPSHSRADRVWVSLLGMVGMVILQIIATDIRIIRAFQVFSPGS